MRQAGIVVILVCCAALRTRQDVAVWHDDTTLWAHAAQMAPLKPRPALNYGVALITRGDLDGSRRMFERATVLSRQRWVLDGDRLEAQTMALGNLASLRMVEAQLGR